MSPWRRAARAPWWFVIIILVLALPSLAFFPEASHVLEQARWLGTSYVGWVFPVYLVLSGLCAWLTYPERPTLAWILVALIALTDIALLITAYTTPS